MHSQKLKEQRKKKGDDFEEEEVTENEKEVTHPVVVEFHVESSDRIAPTESSRFQPDTGNGQEGQSSV